MTPTVGTGATPSGAHGATHGAICRYPDTPTADRLEGLPEDVRTRILAVQEKAGFVPNVFLALARRPAEFRAFMDYHDALMAREDSALTKGEREMIVVATSGANHCLYCVVAHGAILRILEKAPRLADQLALQPLKAEITPRQRAMLDFALKVCRDSSALVEEDYAAVRAQGFDDEALWDIAAIAAFFAMSNRLANAIGLRPNDEFYLMGRVPRPPRSAGATGASGGSGSPGSAGA